MIYIGIDNGVTGAVAARREERALATVMFTDICGSTEIAAEIGAPAPRKRSAAGAKAKPG